VEKKLAFRSWFAQKNLLLAVCTLLLACEKQIAVVPAALPDKLVVEGVIENGQLPVVYLTRSTAFFEQLSVSQVQQLFVRNARLTLDDGSRQVPLVEVEAPFGRSTVRFYTCDPANPAMAMRGRLNTSYKLVIECEGQRYEATTRIGDTLRRIDSLWWQQAPGTTAANRISVMARMTDPKGFGNYIRYFTSVNDSAFLPGINSVFDDLLIDGTTYDIQVFRGVNRNQNTEGDDFGFFSRGQRVAIKLCNIDKATFDFWRTWEQNQQNLGNPFGVPVKVLGNISNGALGYFGGYAVQITQLHIPN
jgi:hypothetical protein